MVGLMILVDCLMLWVFNILLVDMDIEIEFVVLIDVIGDVWGWLIFVMNEVGMGIVLDNVLVWVFCDLVGMVN